MHVDGFRFDLASVLGRDRRGNVLVEPPVDRDDRRGRRAGRHQADRRAVGRGRAVPGRQLPVRPALVGVERPVPRRRPPVLARRRRAWPARWRRGCAAAPTCTSGPAGCRSTRSTSSPATTASRSHDLVSYNQKHNEANGEGNRDGIERQLLAGTAASRGRPTTPRSCALRRRQAKNLMATLLLSQGVPMLLAGDEFLRTQRGNNNAWCQDNEISWVDWELAEANADFLRFVREMIWLRKRHPALRRRRFFAGEFRREPGDGRRGRPAGSRSRPGRSRRPVRSGRPRRGFRRDATDAAARSGRLPRRPGWRTSTGTASSRIEPDFGHDSRSLAFALDGRFTGREHDPDYRIDTDFYVAMNAWREPLRFRIPLSPTRRPWRRVIDTALTRPGRLHRRGRGAGRRRRRGVRGRRRSALWCWFPSRKSRRAKVKTPLDGSRRELEARSSCRNLDEAGLHSFARHPKQSQSHGNRFANWAKTKPGPVAWHDRPHPT